MRIQALLAVPVLAALALVAAPLLRAEGPNPKATVAWEYLAIPGAGDTALEKLNAAGKEGWELVCKDSGDFCFLKRRLP